MRYTQQNKYIFQRSAYRFSGFERPMKKQKVKRHVEEQDVVMVGWLKWDNLRSDNDELTVGFGMGYGIETEKTRENHIQWDGKKI